MIGQRIKQARLRMGLSLDQTVARLIAAGTPLTKAALSKYERGASVPRATTLQALGRVLHVAPGFFLSEHVVTINWLAYRRRSSLGARICDRIRAIAQERAEAFVLLRQALVSEQPRKFPAPVPVSSGEQAEDAARLLRAAWDLGDLPIESMVEVFEARDGILVELPDGADAFDGLVGIANDRFPVLVTQANVAPDRKRFTIAHELGHLAMDTTGVPSAREEERLAHRFAAAFLVPPEVAIRELGKKRTHLSFEELRLLKERHGLSIQAWLYRARDLGIIEEGHFNTLFANLSAYGWRRQEPGEYRGLEDQTAFRQMVYRALAEGVIDHEQGTRWCPELRDQVVKTESDGKAGRDLGPRDVYRMPMGRRETVLREAAVALADVYRAGSPVVVGDALDAGEAEGGGRADRQSS